MVKPTKAQERIRDHGDLDLVVVAPAGCGKTEALALRIVGLLARGIVAHPQRVLATTFSNRARDNIRDRLRTYITPGTMRDLVTVSNFHGLSARIFRAHASVIGLDPAMTLPEHDWVTEQIRSRSLSFAEARMVQDVLRDAKQEAVDDACVAQILASRGITTAIDIERQRLAEGRLTYDDLPRVAEMILANDAVADLYQNHFGAVVVDEYQDLTPQQLRIINRIGYGRTTYAGDLAQGIYGFAGAKPDEIDKQVRTECRTVIEFAESHRSAPAVLGLVNALSGWTGGQTLTCAEPASWPHGGLAGQASFKTVEDEASWAVATSRFALAAAPSLRIGVITRTASRRRFVDEAFKHSDVAHHRWDDGVLDTDTAALVRTTLSRLSLVDFEDAPDQIAYLKAVAQFDAVQDPTTRDALRGALDWVCDLLREGLKPAEVRGRVRIGDQATLLTVPGVHLLTGHVGKGQQFDLVIVIGAEDGCIPDFRANSEKEIQEEVRILSVMISRARHGVIVLSAQSVPAANGSVYAKSPSRFLQAFNATNCIRDQAVTAWLEGAAWSSIATR